MKDQLKNKGQKNNKKGYKTYRTIIEEENIIQLLKMGDLQESYNK